MRKTLTTPLLLTSMLTAMPALAQQAVAPEASDDTGASDIIVTARRIEERLQDVPISITAFSQEQLTNQNVFSGKDLALYTPSLTAQSRYGADYASFAIRGFTQEARTTASVGVYFADVVTPRSSGLSASGDGAGPGLMFDLQNVQVLKGPQGTLFGRNTTGGAVLLVPNRPNGELGGYVEGSIGNYAMRRVQAVLNIPLSDTFKVRAGVDWQQRDGYLRNQGVGPRDFADIDYLAARLSFIGELTPSLETYTIATYSKSTPNGAVPKLLNCYPATPDTCPQIARERPLGDFAVSNWLPDARQHLEAWQVINTTTWSASDTLTIKNIASYGEVHQDQSVDINGVGFPMTADFLTPAQFAAAQSLGLAGTYAGSSIARSAPGYPMGTQATFSEEFQIQGKSFGNRFKWQVGVYFEKSTALGWSGARGMEGVLCRDYSEFVNWSCTDIAAVLTPGGTRAFGARSQNIARVHNRDIGVYAQGSFDLSDRLTLDAGIRYTWDKSWGEGQSVNTIYSAATGWTQPTFSCANPTLAFNGDFNSCNESNSVTSQAPTWMVGLNFKPSSDVLLYAKYSRGYRQGAYYPLATTRFQTYRPEKVDVYEVGLKTGFRGAVSGTFNVSAFYNNLSDMQLQLAFVDINGVAPNLSPSPAILNAGKARIYGLEAEATLSPVEGLNFQFSYAYLNTKLQKIALPDRIAATGTYDGLVGGYDLLASAPLEGSRLQYTPDHKFTAGVTYRLPLDESVGKVTLGGIFVYTGSVYYGEMSGAAPATASIFPAGDERIDPRYAPPYSLVNFNVAWQNVLGSGLGLQAFITNAFDKRYYDARTLSRSRGFVSAYMGEPRMYGLRARYSF